MIYLIIFFKWVWEKISSLWSKPIDDTYLNPTLYNDESPYANMSSGVELLKEVLEEKPEVPPTLSIGTQVTKEPQFVTCDPIDNSVVENISDITTHNDGEILPQVTIEELKLPELPKELVHEAILKFEMPKLKFNLMNPVQGLESASFIQVNQVGIQTKMGSTWIG